MGAAGGPKIPRDNLVCAYDAANFKSYPGSGTTWFDLSGNGSDLTLNDANRHNNIGAGSYMDFNSGIAKYLPAGLDNIPGTEVSNGTMCIFSTIKGPDSDWKTLTRGTNTNGDHQVIISYANGIDLGAYDNDSGNGFNDSGFNVDTLSNRTTEYHFMAWKLSTTSPFYEFFYDENLTTSSGTITSLLTYKLGFASIGGYHNGSSAVGSFSQEWGAIRMFLFYDKHLSEQELREVYNSYKTRL